MTSASASIIPLYFQCFYFCDAAPLVWSIKFEVRSERVLRSVTLVDGGTILPMLSRRLFTGMGVLSPLALTRPNRRFQPGDMVRIVTSPSHSNPNPDIARYYEHWRASVGKTVSVIYVDEHGRPELDMDELVGRGCSISVEPECVALVERSTLSKAEQLRLIESR